MKNLVGHALFYLTGEDMELKHFNQEEFYRFIIKHVFSFREPPIPLSSGRESRLYFNWRNVVGDAFLTNDILSEYVLSFVKENGIKADCFYGIPEGITPLAIICSLKLAQRSPDYAEGSHVLPMGRGKTKTHGDPKDKYFVVAPRGKTVVLEDVVTTGKNLLGGIRAVSGVKGAEISAVISLTDRMEIRDDGSSARQMIKKAGLRYFTLSTAPDILPVAYKILKPDESMRRLVEEERRRVGAEYL